ncbi:MAG: CRISPR-associated endonuclease Cas2 [Blastocatellia bacterium]|nr:CRISPR-associated endonuclease Cas2 [Blastocatellia bacterium]
MLVLITYDISNQKRLRRVARLLQTYGVRLQRSVFECRIDPKHFDELLVKINEAIKHHEDRVHVYRICESCQERFTRYNRGNLLPEMDVWIW